MPLRPIPQTGSQRASCPSGLGNATREAERRPAVSTASVRCVDRPDGSAGRRHRISERGARLAPALFRNRHERGLDDAFRRIGRAFERVMARAVPFLACDSEHVGKGGELAVAGCRLPAVSEVVLDGRYAVVLPHLGACGLTVRRATRL